MYQINLRLACLALFFLILTIGFVCSSDKVFKPGISYSCDEGKSFIVEIIEEADIAFLRTS